MIKSYTALIEIKDMKDKNLKYFGSLALLAFLAVFNHQSHAQEVTGASKEVGPYDAIGASAGSFVVYPGLDAEVEHNDNIFAMDQDEVSDLITHLKPRIEALSNWNRHALVGKISADLANLQDESDEDYSDWLIGADARIDVKRGSYITLGAGYADLHEDRSSLNDIGAIEPTTFTSTTANLGFVHTFNRLSVGLGFDRETLDYDDGIDGLGELVSNRDRNRDIDTVTLETSYEMRSGRTLFARFSKNNTDYEQPLDDDGNLRSSDGQRVDLGVGFEVTDLIEGEVSIGYLSQDFDDPGFESVDKPTVGLDLRWQPSRLTSVTGMISRTVEESIEPDASSALNTKLSLGVTREVRRNIQMSVNAGLSQNDFQQNAPADKQDEQILTFGLGVKYFMNRNYYLTGRYAHETRDSDLDEEDFSRNIFAVGVGVTY